MTPAPFDWFRLRDRPSRAAISRSALSLTALGLVGVLACIDQGPREAVALSGTRQTVSAGQQFALRLQSIGPGEYQSPPTISDTSLTFRSVRIVGPFVPAGVTQEFTFIAGNPGRVFVTFRHTGASPSVIDTIDVQ